MLPPFFMFEQWSSIPRLFDGETVACIASGQSLTREDCERCRELRVIVVNDAYRLAPWADVLYAADGPWWDHKRGVPEFDGIKVTCTVEAAKRWGLKHVAVRNTQGGLPYRGVSLDPSFLVSGGNSGFQAFNLAVLFGAKRIVLLGYDMRGTHFFGEHPSPLRKTQSFEKWIARFSTVPAMLKGVEVINCTRETALKCFPMARLEEVL